MYASIHVCWCTGMQVYRYTGVQVCWYTGVLVYWYTGTRSSTLVSLAVGCMGVVVVVVAGMVVAGMVVGIAAPACTGAAAAVARTVPVAP